MLNEHKKKLGCHNRLTIHGLRHTNVSLQIYVKEDIETIDKQLGYYSIDITNSIYAHVLDEVPGRVAKLIAAALA